LSPEIVHEGIEGIMFSIHHIRSFVQQILLPQYLMNGLNDFDNTYSEYSLASND